MKGFDQRIRWEEVWVQFCASGRYAEFLKWGCGLKNSRFGYRYMFIPSVVTVNITLPISFYRHMYRFNRQFSFYFPLISGIISPPEDLLSCYSPL